MGILGGAGGTGVRIATASDRSRRNSRVIPRPVRRLVVGSEPSAASGRGSEVSEWPRSKFPATAVRQRRNFGHRNRDIRNTPAQIQRGTDCHSQCAHWLRNDTLQGVRRAGRRGRRPLRGVTRGAMGGRPQGSPLRKRYMGCGTKSAGGQGRPPLRGYKGCGVRADVGIGPYGGYKGCNGRATARVAPTKALHGVR